MIVHSSWRTSGWSPVLLSLLFGLSAVASPVIADGGHETAVVVRETLMQPYSIEVSLNDTVLIQNVVDWNRTARLDADGDQQYDGASDVDCLIEADSQCEIWLDPMNWTSGEYVFDISENGSTVFTLNMTIQIDSHPGEAGQIGVDIGGPLDNQTADPTEQKAGGSDKMLVAAIAGIAFAGFLFFAIRSRAISSEEE